VRTPKRNAADPPTNAHISGMTATSRGNDRSAANRNPMVRIVVGHGTPNVGSRGNACPSARAIRRVQQRVRNQSPGERLLEERTGRQVEPPLNDAVPDQ
jgi:hypothetical protein